MIDPRVVPFGHSVVKKTRISSAVITSTLEWTLATHTPFYCMMIRMRKLPASTCSMVYLKPTLDRAVRSFSRVEVRKCLKFVFADLLGILHAVCLVQRLSLSACSESLIDDKLNGRCVVSQIMKSAALNMKAVRASSL